MSNFSIRLATKEDLAKVFNLVQANHGQSISISVDDFVSNFGLFDCFVVVEGLETIIGYATTHWIYSTWEGKSLEIQDMYLLPNTNYLDAGKQLLNTILQYSKEKNCARVDYHIARDDDTRKQLFTSTGAVNLTETESWLLYAFDISDLEAMAA